MVMTLMVKISLEDSDILVTKCVCVCACWGGIHTMIADYSHDSDNEHEDDTV